MKAERRSPRYTTRIDEILQVNRYYLCIFQKFESLQSACIVRLEQ